MASKLSNEHLKIVLTKSNRYRTIDTLILISDLTKQIRIGNDRSDTLFIVPSHNSAYSLWQEINTKHPKIINSTTFRDCLNELKDLNIIKYNFEHNGYELIEMKKMIQKRGVGYTQIKDVFFEKTFLDMSFSTKKLFIYLLHLLDNKKSAKVFKNKYKSDVFLNLNKYKKKFDKNELNIMNIFKTKNVYYAKEILDNLLLTYPDIFISNIEKLRIENYGKVKGNAQGLSVDLTYFFDINESIKDNEYSLQEEFEKLSTKYNKLNNKIESISENSRISIPFEIKISLLRKLYRYLPFVQESIINTVIKRIDYSLSGKKPILNINAFVQYLINEKFEHRTSFSYRKAFERGWIDNIVS